jgi:hypothetical protein
MSSAGSAGIPTTANASAEDADADTDLSVANSQIALQTFLNELALL